MKRRLARLDRIDVRHPIYFVTANVARRRQILADPFLHEAFVSFALAGPEHGAWIGRYVLMPDHCHLFLAYDDDQITLPMWAKSFKNSLSQAWRKREIAAPHWQKGFFDHLLRSDESATEKWNTFGRILSGPDWWSVRTTGLLPAKYSRWNIAANISNRRLLKRRIVNLLLL